MTLLEYLQGYTDKSILPMHMPGHKRKAMAPYLHILGAEYDLTEITGMDDLHQPEGILKECQQKAQKLWHSQHSFFLVNGSTVGILAGIRSCTKTGDTVLVARNCHKSVYNAIELCGLNPVYILPQMLKKIPSYSCVQPSQVEEALKVHSNISAVIITSPTYEGIISDTESIARVAHSFGVPVLVDEAHGAHLDLSPYFTGGAVRAGADIVVQSLHKTLPSLTQTAVLHLNSRLVSSQSVQRQLSVFQTSSPSYLLMSSIDSCIELVQNRRLFLNWSNNLEGFKKQLRRLRRLEVLNYTENSESIFAFDKSKLVISAAHTNITGGRLFALLRDKYKIELEMCGGDYAIAMTSMADSQEDLSILADALLSIDKALLPVNRSPLCATIKALPKRNMSIAQALESPKKVIDKQLSKDSVCAEYIWLYPPGIPIITPGEAVNDETLSIIAAAEENKMNLQKTFSNGKDDIAVVEK